MAALPGGLAHVNPLLKFPGGRRATARLAARQVRRRHLIPVIRVSRSTCPDCRPGKRPAVRNDDASSSCAVGPVRVVPDLRAGACPAPVRHGQGWTGPLGPRSRRSDCMMRNVVVVVNISMSAAASTPVYLAMMGAAARSVTVSRWALTPP